MSTPYGPAGQSTRDMADRRYRARVWLALLVLAGASLIWVVVSKSSALGIGAFGLLLLLLVARLSMDYAEARAKRLMKEERRAIRGARAEEKIGTLLDDLGDDYLVIHDVQSPYGNIDHIVMSKGGSVFVIETKAHGGTVSAASGRLLVNGREPEKDFIAQALKNTYWLRDTIRDVIGVETWITPLVVFTNAFVERSAPIKGVAIINRKCLSTTLQRASTRVRDLSVWESRERLLPALRPQTSLRGRL